MVTPPFIFMKELNEFYEMSGMKPSIDSKAYLTGSNYAECLVIIPEKRRFNEFTDDKTFRISELVSPTTLTKLLKSFPLLDENLIYTGTGTQEWYIEWVVEVPAFTTPPYRTRDDNSNDFIITLYNNDFGGFNDESIATFHRDAINIRIIKALNLNFQFGRDPNYVDANALHGIKYVIISPIREVLV